MLLCALHLIPLAGSHFSLIFSFSHGSDKAKSLYLFSSVKKYEKKSFMLQVIKRSWIALHCFMLALILTSVILSNNSNNYQIMVTDAFITFVIA